MSRRRKKFLFIKKPNIADDTCKTLTVTLYIFAFFLTTFRSIRAQTHATPSPVAWLNVALVDAQAGKQANFGKRLSASSSSFKLCPLYILPTEDGTKFSFAEKSRREDDDKRKWVWVGNVASAAATPAAPTSTEMLLPQPSVLLQLLLVLLLLSYAMITVLCHLQFHEK